MQSLEGLGLVSKSNDFTTTFFSSFVYWFCDDVADLGEDSDTLIEDLGVEI